MSYYSMQSGLSFIYNVKLGIYIKSDFRSFLPEKESLVTPGPQIISATEWLLKYYAYAEDSRSFEDWFDDPQLIRLISPYVLQADALSDLASAEDEIHAQVEHDLTAKKVLEYKVTFEIYDRLGILKGKTTSTISKQGSVIIS